MEKSCLWFDYYDVPEGIGAVLYSAKGIKSLILPTKEREQLDEIVLDRYPDSRYSCSDELAQMKKDLFDYFCGKEVSFQNLSPDLDLEEFSDFERKVYFAVQVIPFGTVRSYGEVAKAVERPLAHRAVGNALGKNPIPILIPCHRILRSEHSLGGFSAGMEWKKRLLELEGIETERLVSQKSIAPTRRD